MGSRTNLGSTSSDAGCPSRDLLSLYVHGVLSEEEIRAVEHHLETCFLCGEYVRDVETVLRVTKAPEPSDPGESFNASLWRRIRAERTKRRARLALYPTLAAAAIALVILLPLSRSGVHVADHELVEQLDLFQHIELIENLDLVESIDLIMSDEGLDEES